MRARAHVPMAEPQQTPPAVLFQQQQQQQQQQLVSQQLLQQERRKSPSSCPRQATSKVTEQEGGDINPSPAPLPQPPLQLPQPTTTTITTKTAVDYRRSLSRVYDDNDSDGDTFLRGTCAMASERETASADDILVTSLHKQEKAETGTMAAVFRASEEGNLDNLKELSDRPGQSVDLSTANKHGETAVHMAASGGHVDVLKFLQDKGVNISMKDKQGDTAIYWAARQGHLEAIRCLHEAGLSLDSQNKSGETALHVAARYGHAHVVDFLCQTGANINVIDSLGETPLHSAAWHGYVHIVQTLCEHGAVLDMRNKEGETALHCAAVRGNVDCVRILLDYEAPLNMVDKRGSTALHLACHRQQSRIAIMLLHAGCEMEALDKETGESALHAACREGLTDVVDALCDLCCRLDIPTTEGLTPLHVAVKAGHIEVVRCLLMSGAQPDTPNKDGLTGAIIALAQGFVDIAELLSKVKGDKGQALIAQLEETSQPLSRLKLKVLGCSGVGKSLLLESLKAGFLGSFFRRRLSPTSDNNITVGKGKMLQHFSLPSPMCYTVSNPTYTKGVEIQQVNIAGPGELSVWDFSGYEPYYLMYDQFLGDVHCLHLVLFSLLDPPEEQLAQVIFWLNFLKARVPPTLPVGYCGRMRNMPRVLLVATHADQVPGVSRDSRGEYVSPPEASALHQKVRDLFQHDLRLADRLFVLDAQLPASPDLKALKVALGREKRDILQMLPKPSGLVEATVAQLVHWRREKGDYPVVSWGQLADMVRTSVNPLASEEHVRLLTHHLQLMGEIQYVESEKSEMDLVVLNPRWLCVDILGTLLSPHHLSPSWRGGKGVGKGGGRGGSLSVADVQRMFPQVDALYLLQVFEALEVCTQCETNGEVEFEFPCLNFMDPPDKVWKKGCGMYQDAVYGGVRLHTSFQSGAQLKYLFPRIQVFLRRNMLGGESESGNDTDDEDELQQQQHHHQHPQQQQQEEEKDGQEREGRGVGLQQWHCGSRYRWGRLEGVIGMDFHQQFLEIKVRGPQDSRYALFFFLEDFVNVVEQVVERVCPGLGTERYILSPSQLRQHGQIVRSYSPTELLRMQLENRSSLVLSGNTTENFLDIACMGCEEVLQHVTLGLDREVSQLTVHTQRLLTLLLDPPDKMGRDWCLLAVTLGLADLLPSLDSEGENDGGEGGGEEEEGGQPGDPNTHDNGHHHHNPSFLRHPPHRASQTHRVLAEWSRRHPEACVRDLLKTLRDLNRTDAVEAVLRTTPAFSTFSYEDPSLDEGGVGGAFGGGYGGVADGYGGGGGGAQGTDTSTNTLLSR